jgi:toxin YoeB
MQKLWTDQGWEHYVSWQAQDKKTLKKINNLIRDIERDPYSGTGKPEGLKGNWFGWWSRRIDEDNRIIYRIKDDHIEIAHCKGHYEDK